MNSKIQIPTNGSVKEAFLYILREIRETQKKIKVKTSRIIKQLEEFLFKLNTKKITEEEIRLLLLGDEDAGLPYGLLYCCGSKSKLDGNLRKSSFYTARFLLSIFEKHPQRKDFLSVFCDLEEDEFKLMSLTSHILSEDKNDMAPFMLIRFVKDKRPHINLNSLIDGKKVIEKFESWYKEYRRVQVEEEIKQTTWKEQEESQKKRFDTEDNVLKDQREEKRKKKMRMLEQVKLNSSEKSIVNFYQINPLFQEFFIKTFQDPLYFQEQEMKQSKIPQRESQQKRKQITNMMTLSVMPQSQIDLIRNRFQDNNIKIEDVIMKLHIDSKDFDPYYVIQILHSDTPNSQFIQSTEKLEQVTQEASDIRRNLIYFFFEEIFMLNNGITRLQKEFIGKEHNSYNIRQADQKSQNKDDDDLIVGSLIINNQSLLQEFDKISSNLVIMKKNTLSLRKCLTFMQKLENLIKLPQAINTAFLQRDFKKILRLFQVNKSQLEKFKDLSIFEQLFSDINFTLMNCFKEIIDVIKNESINYENLLENSLTILDLPQTLAINYKQIKFDDEKTLLESEELVAKLHVYAQEKKILKNQIHPSALVILISIKNKIIFDISEQFEVDKSTSKNLNDRWNTERLKGDLINEFLKFSGMQQQQQVSKNQKVQVKKTIVLNCKTVEKYFHSTFIQQFSNFYMLCLKFQSGQLDYRIGVNKNIDDLTDNTKLNYADGASILWTQAVNLIFQEIVSTFIKSFDKFTKKLQQNWFDDDEFNKESQLFYQRVRSDLEIMGSIFHHFELLLISTKYSIQDNVQKSLLEKTKGLKTELLILYMKILFEEFRNITVKQLVDQDYQIPEKDFFGFQFSPYTVKILSELSSIFQNLGKFHLHEGLFSSNKEIYIQFFTKILSEAFQSIRSEMFNEKQFKDFHEEDLNKEKQYRALIFMHNLRILAQESKEGLMNYTLVEIYNNLQYTEKQKIFSQEIQSVLTRMSQNIKICRKQYRATIQVLYGQIVTKETLKELAIQQINNIFQQYYPQAMVYELHSNGDISIASSTTPRPYLFKWLTLVNEQVCTISLLQPSDKGILDHLASLIYESLIIQIERIIKQDEEEESRKSNVSRSSKTQEQSVRSKQIIPITFWRQVITEVQIFDQILIKIIGEQTEAQSLQVKKLLCQKLNIQNIDEIFNDEDLSNQKNNIIRNFKYKISQNFKALFI